MGQSTNGQICYGIAFEEETEFPWSDENYDDGIEDWWLEVSGFKPTFNPFDDDGAYKPGVDDEDPRIDAHFEEQQKWLKKHPLPVELVNTCSDDYPVWILAVPCTYRWANRGDPVTFNPATLSVRPAEKVKLMEFLREHGIKAEKDPAWYLSSYWG